MKKISLMLLFCMIAYCATSQSSKKAAQAPQNTPVIKGIGIFQIGETTIKDLEKYADEKNLEITTSSTKLQMQSSDKIFLLQPNLTNLSESPIYLSYCANAKVYYISIYDVANISIESIYLTFYNDILISFLSDYSKELIDALTLKYGEPKSDIKEIPTRLCSNESKKDLELVGTWNQNNKIKAKYVINKYLNMSCDESYISYFLVGDTVLTEKVSECSKKDKETLQKEINEKAKKSLGDL